MTQSIITISNTSFNYDDLPKLKAEYRAKAGNVVIKGDGHGNWRNMLLTLQIQGVAELTKEQHERLNELYNVPGEKLTQENINEIFQIFNKIKFEKGIVAKYIGDIVSDRGQCDVPTFMLIHIMKQQGVKVNINISNHDQVFLDAWKNGLKKSSLQSKLQNLTQAQNYFNLSQKLASSARNWNEFTQEDKDLILAAIHYCDEMTHKTYGEINYAEICEKINANSLCDQDYAIFLEAVKHMRSVFQSMSEQLYFYNELTAPGNQMESGSQDHSLQTLGRLLDDNIITENVLAPWINSYIDSLMLFDYQLSPDKQSIALLSHAPFSVNKYAKLAEELGMKDFNDSTAQELANSIDRLNRHYRTLLKNKDERVFNVKEESFLHQLIWTRWGDISEEEQGEFTNKYNGYNVYYIHGHDGPNCVPESKRNFIVSVDSHFAKNGIRGWGSIVLYHWDGGHLDLKQVNDQAALAINASNTSIPLKASIANIIPPTSSSKISSNASSSSKVTITPKSPTPLSNTKKQVDTDDLQPLKKMKNNTASINLHNVFDKAFVTNHLASLTDKNNEKIAVVYQEPIAGDYNPSLQVTYERNNYQINIEPDSLSVTGNNCNACCFEVMLETYKAQGERNLNLSCENLSKEKVVELVQAAIKHGFVFTLTGNIDMARVLRKLEPVELSNLNSNISRYKQPSETRTLTGLIMQEILRRSEKPSNINRNNLFSQRINSSFDDEVDNENQPFNLPNKSIKT